MDQRPDKDPGQVVFVDRLLWSQLDAASSTPEFCRAWLALQCSMIDVPECAVVALQEPGTNAWEAAAYWPDRESLSADVATLAEQTLSIAEPQVKSSTRGLAVAYPIGDGETLHCVVAFGTGPGAAADAVLRQLQWGSVWLHTHFQRAATGDAEAIADRLITVLDLIATALSYERCEDAARALVTEIAVLLECDRVSAGFLENGNSEVIALSHSSHIGGHMNLVRAIGNAMDEAIDQYAVIVSPLPDDADFYVTREHEKLSGLVGGSTVMTAPLSSAGRACGALTFERAAGSSFPPATVELCKAVAIAVGPMLELKRREDRSILRKIADAARASLGRLVGPGYIGRKLVTAAFVTALALSLTLSGTYRVSATSRVEGAVRRVVTAPVEGYIASAEARAGDVVAEGQLLIEFDDRDLRLERVQVSSERAQMAARLQDALAKRERADVQIIGAQIEQADAHLALLDEQVRRTQIRAPFDGIIVSGDLSQSLGAAIDRGAILYEIAPLDRYRVILEVDEHDIADVAAGQRGTLLLAALPGDPLAIEVTRLTSVASTTEGGNHFRVEADLVDGSGRLRPGMEGVAKVDIEERRLLSIWTHGLRRWLSLWTWSMAP